MAKKRVTTHKKSPSRVNQRTGGKPKAAQKSAYHKRISAKSLATLKKLPKRTAATISRAKTARLGKKLPRTLAPKKFGLKFRNNGKPQNQRLEFGAHEQPIVEPTEAQMRHLVEKGRNRGFLTEKEVLGLFPRLEHYIPFYEYFLILLEI